MCACLHTCLICLHIIVEVCLWACLHTCLICLHIIVEVCFCTCLHTCLICLHIIVEVCFCTCLHIYLLLSALLCSRFRTQVIETRRNITMALFGNYFLTVRANAIINLFVNSVVPPTVQVCHTTYYYTLHSLVLSQKLKNPPLLFCMLIFLLIVPNHHR